MAGITVADKYFEAYALGERYESLRRTVDQGDISAFAGLTLDLHPAHLDAEFAGPRYGGRLAHGMLTFALVTGLTVEYNLRAISYGYDNARFPAPLRSGDTLRAVSEVVDLTEHRKHGNIGLVVKQYTGFNQTDETVFVCRHILAVDRQEPLS